MRTDQAYCTIELTGAVAPRWVQLLALGELRPRDEREPWHLKDPQAVLAATRDRAIDLVIDYEHQTDFAEDNGQPAPAAGWIKTLEARADGIWGEVEWTDRARTMIERREYRFLSPVFSFDKNREVKALHRAALTNKPALPLTALAKEAKPMTELLKALAKALSLPETSDQAAIIAGVTSLVGLAKTKGDLLTALAKAVGVAETAKPDEIATAVAKLAKMPATGIATATVAKALGLAETAKPDEIEIALAKIGDRADPARFVPLADYTNLSQQFKTLQGQVQTDRATAAVDGAVRAGKIVPAQRDWAISLFTSDEAKFKDFLDKQPVIVKPGEIEGGRKQKQDVVLDDADLALCRQLAIKPDDFRKTREQEHVQ